MDLNYNFLNEKGEVVDEKKDNKLNKIICVDNYDREDRSDVLVVESVHPYYGKWIVKMLNDKFGGENSDEYFKLVEWDYKLYEFGGW